MKIKEAIETLDKVLVDEENMVLRNLVQTSTVTKHATIMLNEIKAINDIELKYETATLIMQHLDDIRSNVITLIEEYKKSTEKTETDNEKVVNEPLPNTTKIEDKLVTVTEESSEK